MGVAFLHDIRSRLTIPLYQWPFSTVFDVASLAGHFFQRRYEKSINLARAPAYVRTIRQSADCSRGVEEEHSGVIQLHATRNKAAAVFYDRDRFA